MNVSEVKNLKKGVAAVFAVALIGASATPAYVSAASGDNEGEHWNDDETGHTSTDPEAAYMVWSSSFNATTEQFQEDIASYAEIAKTHLAEEGWEDKTTFWAAFDEASSDYDKHVTAAGDQFKVDLQTASSVAENKDQFIDAFNNAKADYFNSVEVAKNAYADELSSHGDKANQIKDTFIGSYNSAKDVYGNDVEALKNQFAADLG